MPGNATSQFGAFPIPGGQAIEHCAAGSNAPVAVRSLDDMFAKHQAAFVSRVTSSSTSPRANDSARFACARAAATPNTQWYGRGSFLFAVNARGSCHDSRVTPRSRATSGWHHEPICLLGYGVSDPHSHRLFVS